MSKEKLSISGRLRGERSRIGYSQQELADIGGVSRVTQGKYERGEGSPNTEYWAALVDAGADVQYILAGVRSGAATKFEDKLAELQRVNDRMTKIAGAQSPRPDPYRMGPLRDLAYSAHLSDEQIQMMLNLLHQARDTSFWLGQSGDAQGKSKYQVNQVFHGDSKIGNYSSGDMTVHHDGRDDKEKK